MSELLKAVRSKKASLPVKGFGALNGVIKLTDFGSDLFFIYQIWQYPNVFPSDSFDFFPLVMASMLVTGVGLLFDLFKIWRRWMVGRWDEKDKDRWENSNLFFEEVPQFLILLAFLMNITHCDETMYIRVFKVYEGYKEIQCNEVQLAHDREIFTATLISFALTSYRVVLVTARYVWSCCKRKEDMAKSTADVESKYELHKG